jgi:hypothetical protein
MAEGVHPIFAGPVRALAKNDADRFYVVSKAVAGLEEHRGWQFVLDMLREREEHAVSQMVDANAILTQAGYANLAGEIVGYRGAARALSTVLAVAAERQREFERAAALVAEE